MPGFNANAFRQNLKSGGARPNLFEVQVNFPAAAGVAGSPALKFTFACQATNTPGFNVGSADAFYFGRRVSFAGDRTYDDWQVDVLNDEDFTVRNAFESWSNRMALIDHNTAQIEKFEGQPVYATALVRQYGKEGRIIKEWRLVNAWPMTVGAMDLSWQDNDRIQTFNVVFRYDYFLTDKIAGLGG